MRLSGKTIGVEAARAIAGALESKETFEVSWMDVDVL